MEIIKRYQVPDKCIGEHIFIITGVNHYVVMKLRSSLISFRQTQDNLPEK